MAQRDHAIEVRVNVVPGEELTPWSITASAALSDEWRAASESPRSGLRMDYLIAGKLAFVAAGAHGIGAATADLLTAEGARVIVADSDGAALADKPGRWHATITTDLSTAPGVDDAVGQVLQTFGRAPDILVNNLGVGNCDAVRRHSPTSDGNAPSTST